MFTIVFFTVLVAIVLADTEPGPCLKKFCDDINSGHTTKVDQEVVDALKQLKIIIISCTFGAVSEKPPVVPTGPTCPDPVLPQDFVIGCTDQTGKLHCTNTDLKTGSNTCDDVIDKFAKLIPTGLGICTNNRRRRSLFPGIDISF